MYIYISICASYLYVFIRLYLYKYIFIPGFHFDTHKSLTYPIVSLIYMYLYVYTYTSILYLYLVFILTHKADTSCLPQTTRSRAGRRRQMSRKDVRFGLYSRGLQVYRGHVHRCHPLSGPRGVYHNHVFFVHIYTYMPSSPKFLQGSSTRTWLPGQRDI